MKATVVPILIGALGIVTKELVQRLEDLKIRERMGTIRNTALLRSARIPRRVLETCCHPGSSGRPSVKLSKEKNNILDRWGYH